MGLILALLLLLIFAVAFVRVGRSHGPVRELELLGGDDPAGAARLIEQELKRAPGLTREEAARRVLRSMRRDSG